jgi:hypothetical protein
MRWRKHVLAAWGFECVLTGKKVLPHNKRKFAVHHFYNASENLKLVYHPDNGILVLQELHQKFHLLYGYKENTLLQFLRFLRGLLGDSLSAISSQISPEGFRGSETKRLDRLLLGRRPRATRITKLIKRLEKLLPLLEAANR